MTVGKEREFVGLFLFVGSVRECRCEATGAIFGEGREVGDQMLRCGMVGNRNVLDS
jgi:hypothetical protein